MIAFESLLEHLDSDPIKKNNSKLARQARDAIDKLIGLDQEIAGSDIVKTLGGGGRSPVKLEPPPSKILKKLTVTLAGLAEKREEAMELISSHEEMLNDLAAMGDRLHSFSKLLREVKSKNRQYQKLVENLNQRAAKVKSFKRSKSHVPSGPAVPGGSP